MPEPEQKLGTGHGAREESYAATTKFIRSTNQPLELVNIHYDRFESLVNAGLIGGSRWAHPRPFPRSGAHGLVPNPPSW